MKKNLLFFVILALTAVVGWKIIGSKAIDESVQVEGNFIYLDPVSTTEFNLVCQGLTDDGFVSREFNVCSDDPDAITTQPVTKVLETCELVTPETGKCSEPNWVLETALKEIR
ncbi:MAG: hypothetical protein ACFB0C_24235 [Leptolyngbyaceae cyanobacterium]